MLVIDGSYGEGGGQIVRSSLALAALTQTEFKLINIRSGRSKPGLAPQHITAVKSIGKLCDGSYSGLQLGTKTLEFFPSKLQCGKFQFDIGTAGSITLVLQACLLPAIFYKSDGEFEIIVRGGTDVNWSPPIDYFRYVFLKHLKRLGVKIEVELIERGYYPKGGGEVKIRVIHSEDLKKLDLTDRGNLKAITGIINSRRLPSHIPHRILKAINEKLKGFNHPELQLDEASGGSSPGTGVVLLANYNRTVLGASALGAIGLTAERVGATAAEALITELRAGAAVDIYSADQLIPYLAMLGGELTVRQISSHAKTNIWLVEKFFKNKFRVIEQNNNFKISY